ncbi:MAG: hypothetical protein K6B44_14315 [Lachnospiraceae bacterium]|nr:hypothetical protein [Lachnospiraceae bacterium]
MFIADPEKLRVSFNEFHNVDISDMPQYGEFCLLELKDGRYTGGKWHPDDYEGKGMAGKFGRGTADTVDINEVSRWHSLERYDLTNCLEDEKINHINLGVEENSNSVNFGDFKSLKEGSFPKREQYCLLILNSGELAAGRWDMWPDKSRGTFIYASALACHSMEEVWAWTALSSDDIFEREEERERERKREEELNRNPTADKDKFKYGTDIDTYYEKALDKLRKEYPWATMQQMKKNPAYVIIPRHGQYIFGRDNGVFMGSRMVAEWTEGSTADEFVDFLCEYNRDNVKNSDPGVKFKYGRDIEVYLDKAYENVKKDYRWVERDMLDGWHYGIKQIDGEWEFVKEYKDDGDLTVLNPESADRFIEYVEDNYERAALNANPVVKEYKVKFGHIEMNGWNLEKYVFSKLKTGDYKVYVQAGDRVTGGGREFFITPDCFKVQSYGEFLDRYLKIVPGSSFGLNKEYLIKDEKLKKFLGFD